MSGARCLAHDNHSVCADLYPDDDGKDDWLHCDDSLPLALLLIVGSFDDDVWGPRGPTPDLGAQCKGVDGPCQEYPPNNSSAP